MGLIGPSPKKAVPKILSIQNQTEFLNKFNQKDYWCSGNINPFQGFAGDSISPWFIFFACGCVDCDCDRSLPFEFFLDPVGLVTWGEMKKGK